MFAVSDSGIGIKEEEQDKVFDDFVWIDLLKNKSVNGTGLGLAILRDLCRLMGGDISVCSEYGGAVRLPLRFPRRSAYMREEIRGCGRP